jgi:hypothetical protein
MNPCIDPFFVGISWFGCKNPGKYQCDECGYFRCEKCVDTCGCGNPLPLCCICAHYQPQHDYRDIKGVTPKCSICKSVTICERCSAKTIRILYVDKCCTVTAACLSCHLNIKKTSVHWIMNREIGISNNTNIFKSM